MNKGKGGAITVRGSISGTGIVVGHESSAAVTLGDGARSQILALLDEFREQVHSAALPDQSKRILLEQTARELEEATRGSDPKPRIEGALSKANVVLESVGATAEQAAGLLENIRKIAGVAGIAVASAAPFVAGLLG